MEVGFYMPKNNEGSKIYDCQRPNALPHSVRYAVPIDGQEPLAGGSSAVFSAHAEVVPMPADTGSRLFTLEELMALAGVQL